MLENRPIVAITIGYIIGIIVGLYCKISIVLLYVLFLFIFSIKNMSNKKPFKVLSFKRYFRYIKLIFTKKVCILLFFTSIISNLYTLNQISQYKSIYKTFNNQEIQIQGQIISNIHTTKYKDIYKVKIIKLLNNNNNNNNSRYIEGKNVYIQIKKSYKDLDMEDNVILIGVFKEPKTSTNYGGFDYQEYLKTKKICGTIDVSKINKIEKNKSIFKYINNIHLKCKRDFKENFTPKVSNLLTGIILGNTEEIENNIKEQFSKSNISHLLAISGMHIGYIIIICKTFKNVIGIKPTYILSIIVLILYMLIIGFHTSAIRATIMAVLFLASKLIYKKSDIWTNICLALLILLSYNPFLIKETGLILSFLGTIGIILYSRIFNIKNKVLNILLIPCSVLIVIIPFLAIIFNQIPIFSLITSCILGLFAIPIFVLGFLFIIFQRINIFQYFNFIPKLLITNMTNIFLKLTEMSSKILFSKIYVTTPNFFQIIIYYLSLFSLLFIYLIYHKSKRNAFNSRIRNILSHFNTKARKNKNKVISIIILISVIFLIIKIIPKDLKIYFIDVGQGDCCLIVTPNNKKILIDGGGSEIDNFDVGKNILIPYLLDRGVKKLDYVLISHFDTDHVGGLLTVMEELKVKTLIISKQGEDSNNYQKFKEIVKEKKTSVIVVGKSNTLKIEKDVYFDILWPNNENLISENILNNNSIVCKLKYKDFSMLFTGDIEEVAEKQILQEYKNNLEILNSTILKVAHHGSKTSSMQSFIDAVKPNLALIGVGENNKFGHPNDEVLKRLKKIGCKIYRTDKMGEITLNISNNGKIKIKKFIE